MPVIFYPSSQQIVSEIASFNDKKLADLTNCIIKMLNYPIQEKYETELSETQVDNSSRILEDEDRNQWRTEYQANVQHIKKQLQDLRKATYALRRKISENQSRIKRTLRTKRSKEVRVHKKGSKVRQNLFDRDIENETEENIDKENVKGFKSSEQKSSSPKALHQKDLNKADNQQGYFEKLLKQLENTHNFLFTIIVKNRIKPRKGKKTAMKDKEHEHCRAVAHIHAPRLHARRLREARHQVRV